MKNTLLPRWTIEPQLNRITYNGHETSLEPLCMKALLQLLEKKGMVVTREEFTSSLWGQTVVSDDSLNRIISQLRKAFKVDPSIKIETIRGIGYRFSVQSTLQRESSPPLKRLKHKPLLALGALILILLLALVLIWSRPVTPYVKSELSPFVNLDGFISSPSISPDNQMVCFNWNGGQGSVFNIYVKKEGSSDLRQFSYGGFDLFPAWSSDGNFIAYSAFDFSKNRSTLTIRPLIGSEEQKIEMPGMIAGMNSIEWSPTDDKIAVSLASGKKGDKAGLFMVDRKSSKITRLIQPDSAKGESAYSIPRFSPDGKKLMFVKHHKQVSLVTLAHRPVEDIMVMDLEKGDVSPVLENLDQLFGLLWSGKNTIMYSASDQIFEYDIKRDKSRLIYSSRDLRPRNFDLYRGMNQMILETTQVNHDLYAVNYSDTALSSKSKLFFLTSDEVYPALNKQGQIAFVSDYSGNAQLWIQDGTEAPPRQVTYFDGHKSMASLDWSPENDRLAYSIQKNDYKLSIECVNIDGSGRKTLVSGNYNYGAPSWSLDGNAVYYYSDSLGLEQIFQKNLQTGHVNQITQNEGLFARETPKGLFFVKHNYPGIWQMVTPGKEEMIVEDFNYQNMTDWNIYDETLVYLSMSRYQTHMVFYDLARKEEMNRIKLDGLKLSLPSMGADFDLENRKLYISSTEGGLKTSLKTLTW